MMLQEPSALPCLWEKLKNTEKPIVLYGTGDGAEKIMRQLDRLGIKISGVFSSDGFVRKGKTFAGFPVTSYSEAKAAFSDMAVLLCFGTDRPEVLSAISEIADEQELYAPDVPVIPDEAFTVFDRAYFEANRAKLGEVYSRLADEKSRRVFENAIKYKLSGELKYLFSCESCEDEMWRLMSPFKDEVYADLGAYTGDTIETFLQISSGRCKKIIALEPDARNFRKLKETVEKIVLAGDSLKCCNDNSLKYCEDNSLKCCNDDSLNHYGDNSLNCRSENLLKHNGDDLLKYDMDDLSNCYENGSLKCRVDDSSKHCGDNLLNRCRYDSSNRCFELYNAAAADKSGTVSFVKNSGRGSAGKKGKTVSIPCTGLDEILGGARVDIIKFDVEGAERDAIKGAEKSILKYRPRMLIAAYHRTEDLFAIPMQILSLNPSYRVYLRHTPCIPAWELNYIFV